MVHTAPRVPSAAVVSALRLGIGLALTCSLLAGCRHRLPAATPSAAVPVAYTSRHWDASAGDCSPQPGEGVRTPCVTLAVVHPEVLAAPSPAVRTAIEAFVQGALLSPLREGSPVTSLQDLRAQLVTEHEAVQRRDPTYRTPWSLRRLVEVLCDTPQVQGLVARESQFTGGAHPNEQVRFATIATQTGRRLQLDDLLVSGARPAFDAIAERYFRSARQLSGSGSLEAAGFQFPAGRFTATDNVSLCDGALRLRWDAYEIAPYAYGPTEITIPVDDLREVLDPAWVE